jgi:hypothetical protein
MQNRADYISPFGRDSAQPRQPRAPGYIKQHRFNIIVSRVRGGNPINAAFLTHAL